MKKIVIIGNFGGGNTGDNIVLQSLLDDIYTYIPKAQIYIPGIKQNVLNCVNSHGMSILSIPVGLRQYAIRFFSQKLINTLASADIVFLTAGIVFGRRFYDRNYSFMSSLIPAVYVAKLKNRKLKVVGYNIGITLDGNRIVNNILQKFLKRCDYIAVRHNSDTQYDDTFVQSHDNVFAMPLPIKYENNKKDYITIGINFSSYCVACQNINWEQFIEEIITSLVARYPNAKIVIIQTNRNDVEFANKFVSNRKYRVAVIDTLGMTVDHLDSCFKKIDVFIGMRMHSLIFALRHSIPIIGIVYDRKVQCLLDDFDIGKYALNINENTLDKLLVLTDQLISEYDMISDKIYNEVCIAHSNINKINQSFWEKLLSISE